MISQCVQKKIKEVDFLFEYEVKNRELDQLCLLAAYLEQKGYTVAFVNSWDALFHKPIPYKAKVLGISACYNDDVYNYFCSHAVKYDKVVNFQWEQLDINRVYDGTDALWVHSGIALKTRHVCWGEKQVDHLNKQMKISLDYLFDCGYLTLDFYRDEVKSVLPGRRELFERHGLDVRKKTILFVSSFALVGLPDSEEANTYQHKETRDFVYETAEKSQQMILEWLERLSKENPDLQVIYRPHPAEAENPLVIGIAEKTSNFYVIGEESIKNWINTCDILYNWQSTSMIEMFASRKPTFLLRPVHIPTEYDLPYYVEGRYSEINSYEMLEQSLHGDEGHIDFPIREEDLLSIYSITKEPAYQRTGDMLIQTLHDDNYSSRPVKRTIFDEVNEEHHNDNVTVKIKRVVRNNHLFQCVCHFLAPKIGNSSVGYKIKRIDRELTDKTARKQPASESERESNDYHRQKMLQNRVTNEEIRKRIKEFSIVLNEDFEYQCH